MFLFVLYGVVVVVVVVPPRGVLFPIEPGWTRTFYESNSNSDHEQGNSSTATDCQNRVRKHSPQRNNYRLPTA
jgi:hypothetical protein